MNVYNAVKRDVMWLAIAWVIVGALLNWTAPHDSCDGEAQRCGLRIRTDGLSGCQYLESAQGALTPRMSRDGIQVCGGGR